MIHRVSPGGTSTPNESRPSVGSSVETDGAPVSDQSSFTTDEPIPGSTVPPSTRRRPKAQEATGPGAKATGACPSENTVEPPSAPTPVTTRRIPLPRRLQVPDARRVAFDHEVALGLGDARERLLDHRE